MRVVVDPNVLVSSRISSLGHPARITRAADEGRFGIVVSERLLGELADVLMRERFRRYTTVEEVEDLLDGLREKGVLFEEAKVERVVPDDPKDDYLVALARVSEADYIISGDPHLTNLEGGAYTTKVLTPREFWELLEREPDPRDGRPRRTSMQRPPHRAYRELRDVPLGLSGFYFSHPESTYFDVSDWGETRPRTTPSARACGSTRPRGSSPPSSPTTPSSRTKGWFPLKRKPPRSYKLPLRAQAGISAGLEIIFV